MSRSRWRQDRLLILCYHGVSIDDEHEWDGQLYITPERLRERFDFIRNRGFNVLRLGDALKRLKAKELPQKSLVITFDDGANDFGEKAYPLLQEYGFPATLYLTTHYVVNDLPVFNTMLSYLLWKARGKSLRLPGLADGGEVLIPVDSPGRAGLWVEIQGQVAAGLRSDEKDGLLDEIAGQVGVDMADLRQRRVLHLMTPEKLKALDPKLIDIQLHTHRHRTPDHRELYRKEIADNVAAVREMVGEKPLQHFCYPSGIYQAEHLDWLKELGAESATTCEPGLASQQSDPLLLPRFVDTMFTSSTMFCSWLSGLAPLVFHRGN
jgi:peptidoglycan/xylan/chitin deacetylase (PgdA/CDA1 family)